MESSEKLIGSSKSELTNQIISFCQNPQNLLPDDKSTPIFDPPLVAFASAGDPLFEKLKEPEVVGPHYKLPCDWLPEARTVISYFLPFSNAVKSANRVSGLPAMEWVYGRIEGEEFNVSLRKHIIMMVEQMGGKAVAPLLEENYKITELRSNWSERHTAYIAGLGTFGLGKSLITKKGCAGRYGSVITSLVIPPDALQYKVHHEFCSNCGKCIKRCPSGAITPEGKNVNICFKYLREVIKPRFAPRYGCGKCQTGVPCESTFPEVK